MAYLWYFGKQNKAIKDHNIDYLNIEMHQDLESSTIHSFKFLVLRVVSKARFVMNEGLCACSQKIKFQFSVQI